jgi:hypothetical protein
MLLLSRQAFLPNGVKTAADSALWPNIIIPELSMRRLV